jgi:Ca2+-binding EF-hand superfamily protein
MATRLTKESIASVFSVFDTNGTGTVDASEFELALKSLGYSNISAFEIEAKFNLVGKTAAGELTLSEFETVVMSESKESDTVAEARAVFKMFDTEGHGKISPAALRAVGQRVTGSSVSDKLIKDIMVAVDVDRDGFISFPEFARAVLKGTAAEQTLDEQLLVPYGSSAGASTLPTAAGGRIDSGNAGGANAADASSVVSETISGVAVTFRDGKIPKAAVRDALRALDYGDAALPAHVFEDLFAESDADQDGQLTRDEYCVLLVSFGEIIDGY